MFNKLSKCTENELILLLKENREQALKEIYLRYEDKIFNYSFRFMQSVEIAQEITQEIFIKLWENRNDLDESLALSPWLFRITKNNILNHIRSAARLNAFKKEYTLSIARTHNNTEEKIFLDEYLKMADRAIDKLPTQCRSVFTLSRQEGKSYAEIAEILGISKDTVRNQIIKSLKSIKNHMTANSDVSVKNI
jgi:RNA polymerase sigma-70 factor (family 1)